MFRVVMACDGEVYIRLLPLAIAAYRKFFDCRISVAIVDGGKTYREADGADDVCTLPWLEGFHANPLSKMAENWYAGEHGDELVLINDVDRIPLSAWHIESLLGRHTPGKITLTGKEMYDGDRECRGKIPLAYVVAESGVYGALFNPLRLGYADLVMRWVGTQVFDHKEDTRGSAGGFSDESLARVMLQDFGYERLENVERLFQTPADTIDRMDWGIDRERLWSGGYVETHTMRPTAENMQLFQPLAEYLGCKALT